MALPWNLHTHTYRCLHATGDAADYAREAAQTGMTLLGISDHAPLPDDRWPEVRMRPHELDDYSLGVEKARDQFPDMTILMGLEAELLPEYHGYFREEILGQRGFDYLIGAVHFLPDDHDEWVGAYQGFRTVQGLRDYVESVKAVAESGMAAFLAHPDLFAARASVWTPDIRAATEEILDICQSHGLAMELNAYGTRKKLFENRELYPRRPFWKQAAERQGLKVVVSSDAHRPQDVSHGDGLFSLVDELGLTLATPSELVPGLKG